MACKDDNDHDYDHNNKNDNEKIDNKRFKKLAFMLLVTF